MKRIFKRIAVRASAGLILVLTLVVASGSSTSAVALTPTFYDTPTTTTTGIFSIITGPDGNMWFTKNDQNQIAKVTMDGTVTEYTIGSSHTLGFGLAVGPDDNIWFNWTNNNGTKGVGKMDTFGANQVYYDLTSSYGVYDIPSAIGMGPDGNMWVGTASQQTNNPGGRILKITTSGVATPYALSTVYPGATYSII
jgi:streptogramin lyase